MLFIYFSSVLKLILGKKQMCNCGLATPFFHDCGKENICAFFQQHKISHMGWSFWHPFTKCTLALCCRGEQPLCKKTITSHSEVKNTLTWGGRQIVAVELFSPPIVVVLVPVSLYGCSMYMTICGSSFYNRLLAEECDSRWLSSSWATGWYESAHECLLVRSDIFLIKTSSRICFCEPLRELKNLSTLVRICLFAAGISWTSSDSVSQCHWSCMWKAVLCSFGLLSTRGF